MIEKNQKNQDMLNTGFQPDIIQKEDYSFGSIESPILCENGQWDDFLPEVELQYKNGVETMSCTVFGTLNCIETLLNYKKIKENYSERYTSILAGTNKSGNSPQKIAQTIRHFGLIDEKELPFDDSIKSWEDFFSPNPMKSQYIRKGMQWLDQWELQHEWVDKQFMKFALKFSPLGVSVFAWAMNDDGLYTKAGMDNHWVMCYGYEEGKYWKIFDHYDQTHKLLEWDYDFKFVKRYNIKPATKKRSWLLSFFFS